MTSAANADDVSGIAVKQFLTFVLAALAGFAGAAAWSLTGLGHAQTRDYLLANPDILPEMADAFRAQEAREALASVSADVRVPFTGAVLGNPQGSKVLVKFTDYGCGYCRASVADIDRLIAADPDLKVVVRERATFPGSEAAARMALAAAKQGKYDAFYHALFAQGTPSEATIATAARRAGLDMEAAQDFARTEAVTKELVRNDDYAQALGIPGTPSWIYGDTVFEGAVGYDAMARIVLGQI